MDEPHQIRVGEFSRDLSAETRPRVPPPEQFDPLCTNCFHQSMCIVALAIQQLGNVAVARCEHLLPVMEGDEPP